MEDTKRSLIESYRRELAEIHPALPSYFFATNGYIVPWNRTRSGEEQINQFLLEPIDPSGEIDEAVLDELIRIWVEESWFGLAVHPPLAFMLLKRKLKDPNSKLSQLLYKNGIPNEVSQENGKAGDDFLKNMLDIQALTENKTETKTRSRRKT